MSSDYRTFSRSTAPGAVAAAVHGPPTRPPAAGLPSTARRLLAQSLPNWPESAGEARRLVGRTLLAWGADRVADSAELVVSELVGNVHRHTGCDRLGLILQLHGDVLRIAVRDRDHRLPVCRPDEPGGDTGTAGRGLQIVQHLADRWGCVEARSGKVVWADLRVSAA
ncbi:ATP-binding protein [Kitasatospora sp. NPDC054939]